MINIKIICLDQSTKITGYSIWDNKQLVDYGTLESNPKEKNPIERMKQQYDLIKKLFEDKNPDYIVIEDTQFQNNYKTYSQLSNLQGVIFSILFERNKPFTIIEPSAWKKFCSIKGRKRVEQKASTIQMVKEKFGLDISEDEADAIGIGIWAINKIKVK